LRIAKRYTASAFEVLNLSKGRHVVELLHKENVVGMLYYCSTLQSNKLAEKKGEEQRIIRRTSHLSSLVTDFDLFIGTLIEEKRYRDDRRASVLIGPYSAQLALPA
jgi:hypothetical protein